MDEGAPWLTWTARAGWEGRAELVTPVCLSPRPGRPATHVCVSARRPAPARGGDDMAWHDMAWHGAGDSIIPSAIPDSHRAAAAAAAAAIAPGGFPFRSR